VSQWIGVHGVVQRKLDRKLILEKWIPALTNGLQLATGHRYRPDLDMVFYADVLRWSGPAGKSKGSPETDALADLEDLDDAELADLTWAVEEIVTPADRAAAAAAARPSKGWLPTPVQTLAGAVERHFPASSGVLFLGNLRQVRTYLRDPQLKAEVDQLMDKGAADATVLIAHSLGSVVAYEYLRRNPGHSNKLLVTLGSPLGLRMVRAQLPAGKPDVARWVDVRDSNDPVTAAGVLSTWYPAVLDRPVDNGLDAHAAVQYLSSRATGDELRNFLPEAGR
jgi:hypothetical protein